MATITLKGIPSSLHRALKQRAERNHRSLNQDILFALKDSIIAPPENAQQLRERAQRFRDSLGFMTTPEEIDAAKREGRE